jgi:hypothetical protein
MEHYKGFLIDGSAVPMFATGFDWYSQGIILRSRHFGSIVEINASKSRHTYPLFSVLSPIDKGRSRV